MEVALTVMLVTSVLGLVVAVVTLARQQGGPPGPDDGGSDDGGGGGGGGTRRHPPGPSPGCGSDPEWWPEFEREFAAHVARGEQTVPPPARAGSGGPSTPAE